MTKEQIIAKRLNIEQQFSKLVDDFRILLSNFGDIPGIADNLNANLIINDILMKKKDIEGDLKVLQYKDDNYIENFNAESYINYNQDIISSYQRSYESYKFDATNRNNL